MSEIKNYYYCYYYYYYYTVQITICFTPYIRTVYTHNVILPIYEYVNVAQRRLHTHRTCARDVVNIKATSYK